MKQAIRFDIKHLLHYRWAGPSIGVRIRFGRNIDTHRVYGKIIPISQWFSYLLIYFQNAFRNSTKNILSKKTNLELKEVTQSKCGVNQKPIFPPPKNRPKGQG